MEGQRKGGGRGREVGRGRLGGRESVMTRYSNLLPVGILRVLFQLVFVCTYIMLCLCRAPCLADSVTPALYLSLCRVRSAGGPNVMRSPARRNNRIRAEILRAQLFSVQFMSAREFRPGESLSSEQCSSTVEFEQSS